ncbi:MAG: glucose-6-phosphate isomerase [Ilumatobacteraceae bacterium]
MEPHPDVVRRLLAVEPVRRHLRDLLADDPGRAERYVATVGDLRLDWSRQPVDDRLLADLRGVAEAAGVAGRFAAMQAGDHVNPTEDRAVGHMALRAPAGTSFVIDGVDVVPEVHAVLRDMAAVAERIRADGSITDVVNIGIGGSDLGPAMAVSALADHAHPRLRTHFVSNVDGDDIARVLAVCEPSSTVFIVVSKTFGTVETLTNARTARRWVGDALGEHAVAERFVAVSTDAGRVRDFGIDPEGMLGFWDWVGGRFSVWSAVGLSLMIAIGPDGFSDFLSGARLVDEHMSATLADGRLDENAVVTLAMIGILHRSVLGRASRAVVPYSAALARLPAHLQQLEMESNGKSVTLGGAPVGVPPAGVVWGGPGTHGQHAFFQLLHQGTDVIPVDLIGFATAGHGLGGHHDLLFSNLLAQAQALALGRRSADEPHRNFDGDRPSTLILAERLTPSVLGQLIALHEHIVFVQGVVWGIDSFDQWGVELGKELSGRITPDLIGSGPLDGHDAATRAAIEWYRSHRGG